MCIRYKRATSSFHKCPGGGPQGGLLTGLLFCLQVNKDGQPCKIPPVLPLIQEQQDDPPAPGQQTDPLTLQEENQEIQPAHPLSPQQEVDQDAQQGDPPAPGQQVNPQPLQEVQNIQEGDCPTPRQQVDPQPLQEAQDIQQRDPSAPFFWDSNYFFFTCFGCLY